MGLHISSAAAHAASMPRAVVQVHRRCPPASSSKFTGCQMGDASTAAPKKFAKIIYARFARYERSRWLR